MTKFVCGDERCEWAGTEPALIDGESDPNWQQEVCPKCGSPNLQQLCDAYDCPRLARVGCVHADGVYRWTCLQHAPQSKR